MPTRLLIIASALLCISFWAAYSLDSFGTLLLSLPGLVFFIALASDIVIKSIKRKSARKLKALLLVAIGVVALFVSFKLSDHGLAQLTKEREHAMTELRPIFLKYRQEHGFYPEKLDDLIPRYLSQIPNVLSASSEQGDPYKIIIYTLENGKPFFRYRAVRGPDANATYDVESGKIDRDM